MPMQAEKLATTDPLLMHAGCCTPDARDQKPKSTQSRSMRVKHMTLARNQRLSSHAEAVVSAGLVSNCGSTGKRSREKL